MSIRSRLRRAARERRLAVTLGSVSALVVSAAGVGVAVLANGTASAAPQPPNRTFEEVPAGLVANRLPLYATQADVTVVVELSGAPVIAAEAEAETPASDSVRQSRRNQVRAAQVPVEQSVRSLGGTVLDSYQLAYNGLKVRIPAPKASQLMEIPDVVAVHPVQLVTRDNTQGVPLIGAPAVWNGATGFHGEGMKIAIIDTGIDYTHADFGGPGTPEAYDAAHANETAPANPSHFGPAAAKVKGGIDLVGDTYNADPNSPTYQPVPQPDPNPLDCNGHGTHVGGTAAGFGVLADGSTYTGPYNSSTISGNSWLVGPGVAPKADLYAVRVFGCGGSADTSVVVDAIEWAVDNRMDVINMSLGSTFGDPNAPDSVASNNAARAGVIVVAASGNEGHISPYMTGSPAAASAAISVAAIDSTESFAGTQLALSTGTTVQAIAANDVQLPDGTSLPVVVLRNAAGGVSLGCDPDEYVGVEGALVVTTRGTCARVARAVFGQKAGAAAVLMINSDAGFPPFEGPITGNPDTGEQFEVTIPFLGVQSTSGAAVVAADGGTATLSANQIDNPGYLGAAGFSSGGPRVGDSWLKPDVAAPGVSIFSAGIGTGNGAVAISGTSMATPHTAGLAALVKQAHPNWRRVEYFKAAIVNTADPSQINGYVTSVGGSGLVQAPAATTTQVVATGDKGTATLNYGFSELTRDYRETKSITVRNLGNSPVSFDVASALSSGLPHTVSVSPSRVTLWPHRDARIRVTLKVPAATAGTSAAFADVAGLIQLTPRQGGNSGISLRVPYYLVPQSVSKIETKLDTRALARNGTADATVKNKHGVATGTADWYAWGLDDGRDRGLGSTDIASVGVQAFPDLLVFAIAGERRWSTAADKEFDIIVDVDRDGVDDYLVFAIDLGLLTAGSPNGQVVTGVLDLRTNGITLEFLAAAPSDSSTILLPVLISQLCEPGSPCLSSSNPRFTYQAAAISLSDNTIVDEVDGEASFNAFTPSISTGGFNVVAPGATATETVTYDATEFAQTPALGFLIVSPDNKARDEAQTIRIRTRH